MKGRKVLSLVLVLAMVLALVPTMAMARTVSSPAPLFRFDFGYSGDAVAEGWTGITENTPVYSAEQGYGLTAATSYSASRNPSGIYSHAATNDFLGVRDNTFTVDIENGSYDVVLFMMETNSTALSTRPAKDSIRATIIDGETPAATTGMLHILTCKQPRNENNLVIPYFTKLPATVSDGKLKILFDWVDERDLINVYDPETDTTYAWSGVTNQCYLNAVMIYPAGGSPDDYVGLLSADGIGTTEIQLPTVTAFKRDFGTVDSAVDTGNNYSVVEGPMLQGLGTMIYGETFLDDTDGLISYGFDREMPAMETSTGGAYFRDFVYSPGGAPYYFMMDLPNGLYTVYVYTGCKTAANVTKVEFNDNGTVYNQSSNSGGQYDKALATYEVEVTNELLKIKLYNDAEGLAEDAVTARLNGIEIGLKELYGPNGPIPAVPEITTNLPEALEVQEADALNLSITATAANGTLSYKWFKDGAEIEGVTGNALGIDAAALTDAGVYKVEVTNTRGENTETVTSAECTVTVNPLPQIQVECRTDKEAYDIDEMIIVTAILPDDVQMAYLVNESGAGLVGHRIAVDNKDGTKTWTLITSLGSAGNRTLTVYADGQETLGQVSFVVKSPAPPAPVFVSGSCDESATINRPFNFTVTTNKGVASIRLSNENGGGLMPANVSFVDDGDNRIWTGTLTLGSLGTRTLGVMIAGPDGVYTNTPEVMTVKVNRA